MSKKKQLESIQTTLKSLEAKNVVKAFVSIAISSGMSEEEALKGMVKSLEIRIVSNCNKSSIACN